MLKLNRAIAADVTLGHYVAKSESQLRAGWQRVVPQKLAYLRTQSVRNGAIMEVVEVGVREFREKLSEYLLHRGKPVAVTRHGATVGYFIPTRAERGAERLRALREAGAAVDAMLARAGATEADIESIVQEFAAARKAKPKAKTTAGTQERAAPKQRR